jgi:hypothetical protein
MWIRAEDGSDGTWIIASGFTGPSDGCSSLNSEARMMATLACNVVNKFGCDFRIEIEVLAAVASKAGRAAEKTKAEPLIRW